MAAEENREDRTLELLVAAQQELQRVVRGRLRDQAGETRAAWDRWRDKLHEICQLHVGRHGDFPDLLLLLRYRSSRNEALTAEPAALLLYYRCMETLVELHRLQQESRDYFKALNSVPETGPLDDLNLAAASRDPDLLRQELACIDWKDHPQAHLVHAIYLAVASELPDQDVFDLCCLVKEIHGEDHE